MLAESHSIVTAETDENKASQIIVYEGYLTQLITQQLALSVPYYTSVRRALINMGCIKQLRRGGGTSPSQWEMICEPTEERFRYQMPTKKPKTDRYSVLEDQVRSLSTQLNDLGETVDELIQAWAKHYGAKEVTE